MEYAKDIIYNLKYDKLVNKNQSRTSRLIQKIKNNTINNIINGINYI